MADISKFTPDGGTTEYNFKDAQARADIVSSFSAAETEIRNAVGWSGKNIAVPYNYPVAGNNSDGYRFDTSVSTLEGKSIVASIENGKTYYISKKENVGNRFRIVAMNQYPTDAYQPGVEVYSLESANEYIFTNNNNYKYLFCGFNTATNPLSGVDIEGMVMDASISDSTFEPYHASVEEEINQVYADNAVLGAKNLLKITKQTTTIDGITYSVDSNGVININGTASKTVTFTVADNLQYIKNKEESSILNGISGGSGSTYLLSVRYNESGTETYEETYSGDKALASDKQIDALLLQVKKDKTVSNVKIYPMIRLASDPDSTYQPYAMTNKGLTDMWTPVSGTLTSDFTLDAGTNICRIGKMVFLYARINGVTSTAWGTVVLTIPSGFRTKGAYIFTGTTPSGNIIGFNVLSGGNVKLLQNVTNTDVTISASWIIE